MRKVTPWLKFDGRPKGIFTGYTLEDRRKKLALAIGDTVYRKQEEEKEKRRKRSRPRECYEVVQLYPFWVLCKEKRGFFTGLLYQEIERVV